jgi:4-amino-4-deoxy-L-arabinose transferase-like glycosyltransferase
MKTISIFLALINALMAGLILVFSLSATDLRQAETWWSLTKITAAGCVILIAMITWMGSAHTTNPGVMALCSLFLVALGAAVVVWTFHLVLVTRDVEFYMVMYGGSLAVQGMASLFGFADDSRNVTL